MADISEQAWSAEAALERLGRLSLRELSMESLLRTVTELTNSVMPGNPETSVLLMVRGRPTTVVSTGQLAVDLDERQFQSGQGPCLHAARTGELVEVADTGTDGRWPEYLARAVEHGNGSSLSVPLALYEQEQVSGALNIYARDPHAFEEESRVAAARFGPYAAVAVGNMYAFQRARDLADNLQVAIESRAVIDQAKGVLMERYKLTPDQAFQVMAQASMQANRKLREVAEELVHTGELRLPSPRGAADGPVPRARGRRGPRSPEHS